MDTSTGVLTVPSAAVRHGQDELFVYVVKPDQTVVRQVVQVERDDGVTAVIAKGLEEGQTRRHRRPVPAAERHPRLDYQRRPERGRQPATRRRLTPAGSQDDSQT